MASETSVFNHSFNLCFLDLNTATEEEIGSVPLVGPVNARTLVEHRPFKNMEEVSRVPGILREHFHALIQAGAVVGAPPAELHA
ncbi:MAG: Helix-hairpin-helix motif [Verrucomicrobiales bacterium]|nr:Helix-hairpin-helix motif [Verrucomicrobiales bacterium]